MSIKSARIRESQKVSLRVEASNLSQRQMLQGKELQLSLEKESLELSTNIVIAAAKEELALVVETEGSNISSHIQSSYSKHNAHVKPLCSQATSLTGDVCLTSLFVSLGR